MILRKKSIIAWNMFIWTLVNWHKQSGTLYKEVWMLRNESCRKTQNCLTENISYNCKSRTCFRMDKSDRCVTVQNDFDPLIVIYGSLQGIFAGSIYESKSKTMMFSKGVFMPVLTNAANCRKCMVTFWSSFMCVCVENR